MASLAAAPSGPGGPAPAAEAPAASATNPAASGHGPEAIKAFKAGDFAKAASGYSVVLAEASGPKERASALSNRAQCYIKLRQYEQARQDALSARALAPENAKAWYRLGIATAKLGRLSEAKAALEEAWTLCPGNPDVEGALGGVRARSKEARGIYPWPEIYARYLGKELTPVRSAPSPVAADSDDGSVFSSLGVEPFVGPVSVRLSPGRGRGLFVTQDVKAGQLVLCAHACATGENTKMKDSLAEAMRRSPELAEAVLCLSRGTPQSEAILPPQVLTRLAGPRRPVEQEDGVAGPRSPVDPAARQLESILYYNQFSMPNVNANAAPIEVTNDLSRSGLWLLPAFVNHSCLPNVQRLIVWDCLFLRASHNIMAGEELFDCYIETLQPVARRRTSLESYGIRSCNCERCLFEGVVLKPADVQHVLDEAVRVKSDPAADPAEVATLAEAAAEAAEATVAVSLERSLLAGGLPKLPHMPLPGTHISAHRMAMLREGFETCTSAAEEQAFQRQNKLFRLLLASLANVLRGHALSLRGLNKTVASALAWEKVFDALEQVIPCSELTCIVGLEALSAKLLSCHLDYGGAGRAWLRRSMLASHLAYGGGYDCWRLMNVQTFAASVLDGAAREWANMAREFQLMIDSYDSSKLVELPSTLQEKGTTEVSSKQPTQEGATSCPGGGGTTGRTGAVPPPRLSHNADASYLSSTPPRASVPSGEAGSLAPTSKEDGEGRGAADKDKKAKKYSPGFEVKTSDGRVSVVVDLPGLASSAEASLEVSPTQVRIRSLNPSHPHALDVPLPRMVATETCAAKWSKTKQQLTLSMLCVDG